MSERPDDDPITGVPPVELPHTDEEEFEDEDEDKDDEDDADEDATGEQ